MRFHQSKIPPFYTVPTNVKYTTHFEISHRIFVTHTHTRRNDRDEINDGLFAPVKETIQ